MEIIDEPTPLTNRKYDWKQYFDSKWRRATQGTDFQGPSGRFRKAVFEAGYRNGMVIETRVGPDYVEFRFTPRA